MEKKISVEGFVVISKPHGEKGAFFTILSKNGLYKVNSSNGNQLGGKNIAVGSLTGSLCVFDLVQKDNGPYFLRGVSIKNSFGNFASDLATSLFFMLLSECVEELLIDDQDDASGIYFVYRLTIESLKANKNPLSAFVLFISKCLEFLGIEPEISACVNCGRTDSWVSFSFDEGGFVCSSCAREIGLLTLPRKELLTYKYLFKTPIEEATPEKIDKNILFDVSDSIVGFLTSEYSAKLPSYPLFKSALS